MSIGVNLSPDVSRDSVAALLPSVFGSAGFSFFRSTGLLSISSLCLLVVFCLATFFAFPAFAQDSIDTGKEALAKKTYPWYDANTDGTRSLEMRERPEARSSNRDNIPLRKTQLKKAKKPLNPPAGGGGGAWNFGGGLIAGLSALTWAMIIAVMLLVIGVLIWAMLRMSSQPAIDDEVAPVRSMAESIKQLPFELDTPTGDFRQQAHAAYAAGDYQRAMTYLFSHVLVTLDQKGLVRLRRGKTNRQYLRELRPHQPIANYYQHVMVPFESSFFGDHELSKRDFETCWERLDTFQSDVELASRNAVTSQNRPDLRVANA